MSKRLELTTGFQVKKVSNDDEKPYIEIEGYANTTDKDRVGDVIVREAWEKGGLDNYKTNPVVLAYHDHEKPIGTVTDLTVTDNGLRVVAKIFKAAGNVYELIKEGILKTFSVGFRVKDADYNPDADIFVIKDLELFEVSVVSVPANVNAVFSVKKSLSKEELEEFKKEAQGAETTNVDLTALWEEKLNTLETLLKSKLDSALEEKKGKEKDNMTEPVIGKDMVEELLNQAEERITKQFEEKEKTLKEALEDLQHDLHEKATELEALQKSKMKFEEPSKPLNPQDVDTAVLIAKALKKRVDETKFGAQLIEKAGVGPHLTNMTETWEEEFSTRLENDIREELVVEPLFKKIQMNTASMHIPINPEASYAEFIARTYPPLRSTDGSSTGTAKDHKLTDRTLSAHKLVAKEYLGLEEEEDAIIPLMPIVRDAVMRRMAKAADRALLRGDTGVATPEGDIFPFDGIATIASNAGASTTLSIGNGDKVTAASLQSVRRLLGAWGLDPSKLIYIVSHEAYFDLLEDPDFRTMDVVGSNATILKGQIGSVNGSPVIVSGEYASKGAGAAAVTCINTANFLVGQLRKTKVETDYRIENQNNIIVASRRMGFVDLIAGKGTAVLDWAA